MKNTLSFYRIGELVLLIPLKNQPNRCPVQGPPVLLDSGDCEFESTKDYIFGLKNVISECIEEIQNMFLGYSGLRIKVRVAS